ncbi:hypothetical protein SASPL_148186 [Salvia splendens]|uniref:Uncharacterized protein n=1 Tax=Salvia splendens TaxID=180675 RepID=A0A8X8Z451_SALSN|nr:hypothetical protein SASPL_148186 [Salvia splendens]
MSVSHLENCWKTKGCVRDPLKNEYLILKLKYLIPSQKVIYITQFYATSQPTFYMFQTDLAHHHPYAKALKNFGKRSDDDRKEVQAKICRDGKAFTFGQLQTLYNDWIMEMHDRYDEETEDASKEKKNKKLDLKSSGNLYIWQ